MRSFWGFIPALALGLVTTVTAAEPANSADELKKKAEANWETVGAGKAALHETKHFVVCAPEAMARRLKDVGNLLEKHHDKAKEALKFDIPEEAKGEVLPGRVTVYLFAEREHFTAFVRRIESRRFLPEETGSYSARDDKLHVAASPPRGKQGLPVEIQACEQVASLLLARRAGVRTPLPDWVTAGFGRATYYRVAPRDKAVLADRGLAANLSRKRGISDVWDGKIAADEADAMQGSLMDFLAYGPAARVFPKFIAGFAPEENMEKKTAGQAFEAADLKPDKVAKSWKAWAPIAR
ncbi:MAG TPA: hypothetical protein VN688_07265 [Gemmataceae bacterium]|nr:hypothetical protein [Gemmataceae bacterium]